MKRKTKYILNTIFRIIEVLLGSFYGWIIIFHRELITDLSYTLLGVYFFIIALIAIMHLLLDYKLNKLKKQEEKEIKIKNKLQEELNKEVSDNKFDEEWKKNFLKELDSYINSEE